ncbi:hypothetical protein BKH41_09205 [Helicobacter sp. 12S02232-10]|nr:hypothetical protein BKH41_09205 [Helicobacter sp. 12S02232-10]
MHKHISFYEALQILQDVPINAIGKEKIVFSDALGRTLGEDIVAEENMPKFPTSSMDGYAFRYEDIDLLYSEGLILQGDNPAGDERELELNPKMAIKTFTGSRMPKNSDTLIIVESVFCKDGRIFLNPQVTSPKKGDWVRQIGENYAKGDMLLQKGTLISPYEIGLLADLNRVFIEVFRKPRVGILSGGAEIVEVGQEVKVKNCVRSVNNHLLKAMVASMGGEGILYPIMPDDKEKIVAMMSQAFLDCDILLTTGGMSMGDYDFTQEAMAQICEIIFKGVRIKPGKPISYALYHYGAQKKPLLALAGFPNSAAITFYLFGSVIFAKMFQKSYQHHFIKAFLKEDILRTDSRMEFRVCDLEVKEGRYEVSFSSKRVLQSSVVNNLCGNSGLVALEENGGALRKGDEVEVLLFKNFL